MIQLSYMLKMPGVCRTYFLWVLSLLSFQLIDKIQLNKAAFAMNYVLHLFYESIYNPK